MLNISHWQTTSYHPESNGAVKRLHCRLKDALCARAAVATWSEELPFVFLGIRAQPREDTGLSPAESLFGTPIVLPNEFLQTVELSVDSIINNVSKTLDGPASSLLRHNSSVQLPSELPAELLSAPLIWVHRGAWSHLSPRSTMDPTPFSAMAPDPSPSEVIAVSRLKTCMAVDAEPGCLLRCSRHSLPAPLRDGPGTVFLPGEEVFVHL
jgi:hypothetical protein